MKIKKVLNNNTVIVVDGKIEKIAMGAGVGFNKRKGDSIPAVQIEKVFVMAEEKERFQELLQTLPLSHIDVAEEIISYAERMLGVPLNSHIHIALTDHLSFAIERIEKGFVVENKLINEIKALYPKEYQIGVWAKSLIQEKLGVLIPEDEIGHIALHIHTAKEPLNSMQTTVRQATILKEIIEIIEKRFQKTINHDSIAYQRLTSHVRFALQVKEAHHAHDMDDDMFELIKKKYEQAYACSVTIKEYLQNEYGVVFPESELAYITLHIQSIYREL
ncbi:PRD domain-containing protein [Bacillus alkalicellulosilyticus]|uniref:PRD domain-containing protein n=1 Tax=Alkalihalobacterium alkalicellulosilyticum TaxID=1912214 RepID=UPI000996472D|nr:PRD domain-containing protein [Bacillus alkalicellulosilyticus]